MKRSLLALVAVLAASPLAAQDWAVKRLDASPRHHEWVAVERGDRTIHTFVAFPQTSGKATTVIVIHENRGLTDWVRLVADQLAAEGYIALAPDLLSGAGPKGGRTSDFPSSDAAREAIGGLAGEQVTADLDAVVAHGLKLPASNGKLAVSGFCWGGGRAFRQATENPDVDAAFVFYGSFDHTREQLAKIQAPVYGFYGGNDARINETIPATEALMGELGKTYEPVIYPGAGHGFMRAAEEPQASEADEQAREAAWKRWVELLAKL